MKFLNVIAVIAILALMACGGSKEQNNENQPSRQATDNEQAQPKSAAETQIEHPGKEVYNAVCMACHMADGSGVPGMHPPITDSEFVNGDKERLIGIVLNGMSGKIEVKGKTYNSIMPAQAHLTNRQIANVLSYVRSNFENNSGPITPEEVEAVRKANQN